MTEAFAKRLSRCRKAHFVTGALNALFMLIGVVLAFLVYVLVEWVPQLIDTDVYTDEQRAAYKEAYPKLMAVVWVVIAYPVLMLVLTFIAFHVAWCLKRGRFYGYCMAASWVQGLHVPIGTPAAVMAVRLMKSREGQAHFGRSTAGKEEGRREHESETLD